MEQGDSNFFELFSNLSIAKQSDLSWKKEKLPSLQSADSLTTIYKHYILIFDPQRDKEEDCVVFNTQNGTSTQVKTGLNFSQRKYFSFCHWKNNIFILFETIYISKGSKFSAKEKCDANVLFLSVIENYGKFSWSNPKVIFCRKNFFWGRIF